jgi:hypothetical protein
MDYQQQQQGSVGGGNYVQPTTEDPRYSITQPFQTNGAPESNTSAALAPKTAYLRGGAPPTAGLGVEEQNPNQSSPAAATVGLVLLVWQMCLEIVGLELNHYILF